MSSKTAKDRAAREMRDAREEQRKQRADYDASVAVRFRWFSEYLAIDRALRAAKDERAGTVPGKLLLIGKLDLDQYAAAMTYTEVVNRFRCTQGIPGALYDGHAMDGFRDEDKAAEAAERAKADLNQALNALTLANATNRFRRYAFRGAVNKMVIEDRLEWPLLPSLKRALNVLHQHFK